MDAQLPDLTKLSFYQQLMLEGAGAKKPDPYVRDYYRDYPQLAGRLPTQRHLDDGNIYTFGASKYRTNLYNHFRLSFKTQLKKYLRVFQAANGLTEPQFVWTLSCICGWKPRRDSHWAVNVVPVTHTASNSSHTTPACSMVC
ncbi:hypothetical protein CXG81DRAFT_28903 [Caulochytrium protostelioides]|uniref:Uncharacterized protein n=1 Tax=Caulochytrium protostelioides TaxID=1555241 RepID=A0A4P9X009_9FUNG|nr:hypothetical protein CXG81DRAFT_28903 [Caulochytrium protostelioides]|eukprot:RKO98262.1 hypothetical protein CXG81DRAFT_28903 [Caulochytrium protostelioides]